MTDNEINSLKTDIALIQRDVKAIEIVFKKVDAAVGQMSELLKASAVQETILENNDRRLTALEENFVKRSEEELIFRKELSEKLEEMKETFSSEREKRHREIIECINGLNNSLNNKIQKQDERIRNLESWRWYLIGAGAAIIFILNKFPFLSFFG